MGQGGGAGGSGGRNATFDTAYPGVGTYPYLRPVNVTPNTSYSITIGGGGTGGAARTASAQTGTAGGNTTFGALQTFAGAPAPTFSPANTIGWVYLYCSNSSFGGTYLFSGFVSVLPSWPGFAGSYTGGYAGAPGYTGSAGGSGGAGNAAGTGTAGGAASGIGAGGGSGGGGSTAGGAGGNGAPGQLWVIWVE